MRRVNQASIAKMLGLSQQAVSKALRGDSNISQATIERVRETASKIGYYPSKLARSNIDGKTAIIGVLFPTFSDKYFSQLIDVIEDELHRFGYNVLLCKWRKDEETNDKSIHSLLQYCVEGMIVIPKMTVPLRQSIYKTLLDNGKHILFLNQKSDLPGSCCVYPDDITGTETAVNYLIERGHRHISLLIRDLPNSTVCQSRYQGYKNALKHNGLPFNRNYVFSPDQLLSNKKFIGDFLKRNPETTAFFCYRDMAAVELIDALEKIGKKVPDDISVVGYENSIYFADYMKIPLTTITRSCEELGKQAVKNLLKMIRGDKVPNEIRTTTKLIERSSVKSLLN